MSPVFVIIFSLLLLVTLLAGTSGIAQRLQIPGEIARKFIHIGLGLYCLSFPLIFTAPSQVAIVCAASVALMLAIRTKASLRVGLGHALHKVGRKSYGEMLFAVSVALLFFLRKGSVINYVLPLTILTISDAAAALIGASYGRKVFRIADGHKSWEGAAIFFLTGWVIALIELLLLTDAPRVNVVLMGLIVAVYGTLIEAESWQGWDNLFVPLALHMLLSHHLEDSPTSLLIGTASLCGGITAVRLIAPRLGSDRHTAYVMASVLATIAIASTAWNVALPIAMFLADILAQRRRQFSADFTHLASCLSAVVISLIWYVISDAFNLYTVFSFDVTLAVIGVGLLWLTPERWCLALLGSLGFWGLVAARGWIDHNNHSTDPLVLALCFVLFAVVAALAVLGRLRLGANRHFWLGAPALCAGLAALPFGQP